ncbi:hypothetical protein THAOC_20815 [Thalassiosira oceanica]|uniref:Uncharacterized protein n=1 Tax=Thalassiosira oceanica TaxID=159749 RepID=K0S2F3_THAOC|nr:hypothetical protein THAOC_20815 [Thalassiosira oceanica]|eukprot:EJK59019.1 hypothetical protein THAOC_20815 [Thalassiosira oceanica]
MLLPGFTTYLPTYLRTYLPTYDSTAVRSTPSGACVLGIGDNWVTRAPSLGGPPGKAVVKHYHHFAKPRIHANVSPRQQL